MANTYTLLASNVLGSNTASVTFSSIPQTYTDLVLISSVRSSRTPATTRDEYKILVNGTTANYSNIAVNTDGAGTSASTTASSAAYLSGGWANTDNMTAAMFSSHEIYFPQYTVSRNKPMYSYSGQASQPSPFYLTAISSLWTNTAAITSLAMYPETGPNWVAGSSFYLYGIKNS
jgi:hypothetical protein